MKPRRQNRKDNGHLWALRILTVLISTVAIVYFMPRLNSFNYEYRVNQPWHYGALIASQKFNIQMSDSAIQAQQDSVRRSFQPYFTVDATVLPRMKNQLAATVIKRSGSLDDKVMVQRDRELRPYLQHVAQMLDTVYAHGIMTATVHDSLSAAGVESVRLVDGNIAHSVPFDRFFSPHSAYLYIINSDPEHFQPAILSKFNINTLLDENTLYDVDKSHEECEAHIASLTTGMGFVMANEKIVDRGEIITEEIYQKLRSYERVMEEQDIENERLPFIALGQTLMVLFILLSLMSYLTLFRRDYIENPRCTILLFTLLTVFSISASLMVSHHFFHIFALPCCMVPIIVRVLLDSRTAYIFHTATVLIISLVLSYPYEFLILQIAVGMVAIQTLRELSQRSQIIHTALLITFAYLIFYVSYEMALGINYTEIDSNHFVHFTINGVLLLFTYPLLWLFEKSLGFISDVTLVELTNINHPLLQRMTEVAPGTFQHSMQVANLASEVAKRIGAKAQLVRTGALYHDIGKMERPVFFTENQSGANPHKHLTAIKSAEVIIAHVSRGLELASQHNLPAIIRRFISTHHGQGKVKYFYITYKNEHPDEPVDDALFTYPGPNPATREEAILMMCDGCEAASRSLAEYTEESISALVDRIVDTQVADGFFTECNITFRDIAQAKAVLKDRLKNVYHTRITYPDLKI